MSPTLGNRLFGAVDRVGRIRADQSSEQMTRARVVASMCLLVIVLLPPGLLTLIALGPVNRGTLMVLLVYGAHLLALGFVRSGRLSWAAWTLAFACNAAVVFFGIHEDGMPALLHPLTLVAPCLAIYLLGSKRGLVFTGLVVIETVGGYFLHLSGNVLPLRLLPADANPLLVQVGVQATLLVGALAWLHSVAHERANAALAAAEIMLRHRQKLEAMGTLSAGIAHEINNPLSFVISNLTCFSEMAEELRAHVPAEALEELLACAADASMGAERIKRIVKDIKAFSRTDDEELGPVDVGQAIREAIKISRTETEGKATIELELRPVPPVRASEHSLMQVLVNLIVNAAQALPPGGVGNRVKVAARPSADGRIEIEVEDNGAGMSPKVLERIFEPFFTTKPVGKGTGLGLPICHGIVARFGGEIQVTSQVGAGTTMRVLLPSF